MNNSAREEYLAQEVFTATPQKLQLMLIEAALRFGERTKKHWELGQSEKALECIQRCQSIVSELLGGLAPSRGTELYQHLSGVYLFAYRSLVESSRTQNENQLNDVLRVLEIERDTWRDVCEKLGTSSSTKSPHFNMSRQSSFSLEG